MLTKTQDFWKSYYEDVEDEGNAWLDCSNERTHLQTIAVALEAAGKVIGRRCLELGCGRGHLSRCLGELEATEMVAVDQVDAMLAGHVRRHPQVDWRCVDASDHAALDALGRFDLVFAVEVLQYLPIPETLRYLASRLRPGGRLVAVAPNAACPLVRKASDRFDGAYVGTDASLVKETLEACPDVDWWACRGMAFAADQRVAPYELSPWTTQPRWPQPPNRLVIVAEAPSAS